jgi:hypothetical protein
LHIGAWVITLGLPLWILVARPFTFLNLPAMRVALLGCVLVLVLGIAAAALGERLRAAPVIVVGAIYLVVGFLAWAIYVDTCGGAWLTRGCDVPFLESQGIIARKTSLPDDIDVVDRANSAATGQGADYVAFLAGTERRFSASEFGLPDGFALVEDETEQAWQGPDPLGGTCRVTHSLIDDVDGTIAAFYDLEPDDVDRIEQGRAELHVVHFDCVS